MTTFPSSIPRHQNPYSIKAGKVQTSLPLTIMTIAQHDPVSPATLPFTLDDIARNPKSSTSPYDNAGAIAVWKWGHAKMTAVDPARGSSSNTEWKKKSRTVDSDESEILSPGYRLSRTSRNQSYDKLSCLLESWNLLISQRGSFVRQICVQERDGGGHGKIGEGKGGVTFARKRQRFDPKYVEGAPRMCLHPVNVASGITDDLYYDSYSKWRRHKPPSEAFQTRFETDGSVNQDIIPIEDYQWLAASTRRVPGNRHTDASTEAFMRTGCPVPLGSTAALPSNYGSIRGIYVPRERSSRSAVCVHVFEASRRNRQYSVYGGEEVPSTRDIHESSAIHTIHCLLEQVISERNVATDVEHTSPEDVGDFVTSEGKMVISRKDFKPDRFDGLRKCWAAKTPTMISVAVGQLNPRVHSTNDGWLGLSYAWTCRLRVLLVLSGVFSWRTGRRAELFLVKCFDPIKKDDPQDRHVLVPLPDSVLPLQSDLGEAEKKGREKWQDRPGCHADGLTGHSGWKATTVVDGWLEARYDLERERILSDGTVAGEDEQARIGAVNPSQSL
ncbi:hypothetical protein ARMGADRAFT_1027428 [Armillaria gallica]|uniref:Uncharacterized protein n=1 Tax=Armillaria gallica TaxID=47427 RepID=A0A2H3DZP1_ARMGA|nr:hypothetical protein ARMGADRAFT_1027428 [Armillaria gallica]